MYIFVLRKYLQKVKPRKDKYKRNI